MKRLDHTPGPWAMTKRGGDEWRFGGRDGAEIVIHPACQNSQSFAVLGSSWSSTENEANARLIAAAPRMYAELWLQWVGLEHDVALGLSILTRDRERLERLRTLLAEIAEGGDAQA